jgi:hypothetical protein
MTIVATGYTTSWTSGGQTISVHTDPLPGETDDQTWERHVAACKIKRLEHPRDE